MDDFLKAIEGSGRQRSERRIRSGGYWGTETYWRRPWKSVRDKKYLDPLDPVCELVRDDVLAWGRKPGLGPVRVCKLLSCRQYFVRKGFFPRRDKRGLLARRGRCGEYCSERCKSRSRPKRPDEMYKSRARKLRRAPGGRLAIQAAIEKLKRRKFAPSRKRRLAILRGLL